MADLDVLTGSLHQQVETSKSVKCMLLMLKIIDYHNDCNYITSYGMYICVSVVHI